MRWLIPLLLVGCATVEGARRLDEMTEDELERYAARTAAQVEQVASVAVSEGDLTQENLDALAGALRALAGGGSVTSLMPDVDGYESLALVLFLTELDHQLEVRGAYDGTVLNERGVLVVNAVADALEED